MTRLLLLALVLALACALREVSGPDLRFWIDEKLYPQMTQIERR